MKLGWVVVLLNLFALCTNIPLVALDSDVIDPDSFAEALELSSDPIEAEAELQDHIFLLSLQNPEKLKLQTRFYPQRQRLNSLVKYRSWVLHYSQLRKPEIYHNLSLYGRADRPAHTGIALASYRPDFALGLVLGSSTPNSKPMQINPATEAGTYYPLGLAVSTGWQHWNLDLLLSAQQRAYNNIPGYQGRLSRTKQESLLACREELSGLSISYQSEVLDLALLVYRQAYSEVDSTSQFPTLDALSLAADWQRSKHRLALESAFTAIGTAQKMIWDYRDRSLRTRLTASNSTHFPRAAYAAAPHQLRDSDLAWELSQSVSFPLLPCLSLELQTRLMRDRKSLDDSRFINHNQVHLSYRDSLNTAAFQIRSFNRELLSYTDSLFLNTVPIHLRYQIDLSRKIRPKLKAELRLRYNVEDKSSYRNNSYYWKMLLDFNSRPWSFIFGFTGWQSIHQSYIWETDINGDLFRNASPGQDEVQTQFALEYSLHRWKISLQARVSLLQRACEQVSLSLQY